ncbi:hypothetical protein LTR08_001747 [Meristemomyces frigidus]|nr:hypothetical protein LTR08_001747 [Meristemomyces frigidus]
MPYQPAVPQDPYFATPDICNSTIRHEPDRMHPSPNPKTANRQPYIQWQTSLKSPSTSPYGVKRKISTFDISPPSMNPPPAQFFANPRPAPQPPLRQGSRIGILCKKRLSDRTSSMSAESSRGCVEALLVEVEKALPPLPREQGAGGEKEKEKEKGRLCEGPVRSVVVVARCEARRGSVVVEYGCGGGGDGA